MNRSLLLLKAFSPAIDVIMRFPPPLLSSVNVIDYTDAGLGPWVVGCVILSILHNLVADIL